MKNFSDNVETFGKLMTRTMGFQEFQRDNGEVIWQISVSRTPYSIQVRSGMRADNSYLPTPDIGIRIYLIDTVTQAVIVPIVRVRRTQYALRNVRERIGHLWRTALQQNSNKIVRR